MLPPAPPRLSITTGWPRLSWSFCPSTRPTMSVPPPAGYGTMSRIGWVGKGSVALATTANISTTPPRAAISARRLTPDIRASPRASRLWSEEKNSTSWRGRRRCAAGFRPAYDRFVGANEQGIRHDWGVPGQGPRPGNDEGFDTSGTAAGEAGEKGMLNQKRT